MAESTKAPCIFCDIVSGKLQVEVVYSDEIAVAFLDHRPLFPGHCLLVPRKHYETLLELPGNLVGPFFKDVQLLAGAVLKACHAEGTFVAINNQVSQSVPHLHVHIVPRRKGDGLKGFFWPRQKYKSPEEMQAVAEAIRKEIAGTDIEGSR